MTRSPWPERLVPTWWSSSAPGVARAWPCGRVSAAATKDYVVMIDADGSMDPGELDRYVRALDEGNDVVKGSRFLPGGGSTDLTLFRSLGNRALLTLFNTLYGAMFTELCYGFFAFRRTSLPAMGLRSDGFEIETEIVARSVRAQLAVAEVASHESPRLHGQSNLHPIRDGLRVLRTLFGVRLSPRPNPTAQPTSGGPFDLPHASLAFSLSEGTPAAHASA